MQKIYILLIFFPAGGNDTEVSTTPGLFKYMRKSGLSEGERQGLIGRLEGESQSIRLEFATLVHSTETELKWRNIAPKTLVLKLSYYDVSLGREFDKTESIEDIFFVANNYWSFFNYDLLEYVINTFTLSTTSQLARYVANFQEYCKRRLCECPSDVAGSCNESGRRIVLKIEDKMSVQTSTLQDLRRLQDQASKVTGVKVMQLLRIEEGCLHLVNRIPHQSIEKINFLPPYKKKELKDIGILSITCEKKMIRWQVDGKVLKRLVGTGEKNIMTTSVVITEMAEYKTEITLSLGVNDTHVRINAVVTVESGQHEHSRDMIRLKVIPALHLNREAKTMPCTEVSNKLRNFEVPHVMPLHKIAAAEADVFEFFVELYIESPTSRFKGASSVVERMRLKPAAAEKDHSNSGPSFKHNQQGSCKYFPHRNSLPPLSSVSYPTDLRWRSSSTGDHYLITTTPTEKSPQRSAPVH